MLNVFVTRDMWEKQGNKTDTDGRQFSRTQRLYCFNKNERWEQTVSKAAKWMSRLVKEEKHTMKDNKESHQ